ncbi:hypothetical protein QO010_004345 [Caulobacter ginsengisoli]|uniref:eCIS core domain-containing protein n=1 Tax=Caulobacter ginsengisoli TaxID=400775 RepID=A0ABU0IX41_9CAUL|nr:DUF4157 domain-containing protein [Caulobacter ginsengisoli]MDQ0466550.1 hypothetical protein [Caulobacter ginsengisoli]
MRQLQAKLKVGEVNDPLEHEADAAADRVMGMADAPASRSAAPPSLQRQAANATTGGGVAPAAVDTVLQSPGAALDPATHDFMADRFGEDFSDVRIHTDAQAARSAEAVEARAYTVGRDIVFGAGQYDPAGGAGRRLLAHELAHVVQQGAGPPLLQRDKAPPKPLAGGNILYIGMNAYQLEVQALKNRYFNRKDAVTTVTRTTDTAHTAVRGGTFDMTTDAGIDSFAAGLGLNPADTTAVAALIKSQPSADRDDLAHVTDIYAQTNADGIDRMSRVILSGHSYGSLIYGHAETKNAETSHVQFDALIKLAGLFPKAAGQTKHLMVAACLSGSEGNLRNIYLKAYPNLQTFTGETMLGPSGQGAADEVANWARKTDSNPTKLDKPRGSGSNWTAAEGYKGDSQLSGAETMTALRNDEAKFNEYFAGTKADANTHAGPLTSYYIQARLASQNAAITGADHDYAQLHADQSFRLRFWKAQVAHFWVDNGAAVRSGYGSAAAPDYGTMSRADALKAIAAFPGVAAGGAAEITAAKALLEALRTLDTKVMSADWLEMP